jgi:hypothetical protein
VVIADPGVGGSRMDSSLPKVGVAIADGIVVLDVVVVVVSDDEKVL